MKKKHLFYLLIILSCSAKKNTIAKQKTNQKYHIVTPQVLKTYDQTLKYPFIHINGFKDFEINSSNLIKNKNSSYAKELRFNATYSSFYTKNVMYEKFGLWDEEYKVKREKHPVLIWKNVKLFNDENLYTVYATGFENSKGDGNQVKSNSYHKQVKGGNYSIYASIIVLDSSGKDCLSDDNLTLRKSIIEYFSNGIKNLTSNNEFYDLYWKAVRKKK